MRLKEHTKPASILIPGPTGVGKSVLIREIALATGVPYLYIDGGKFSDEYGAQRLLGTLGQQGILYSFARYNPLAIVFFDEFDQLHTHVRAGIQQFTDEGTLEDGQGRFIRRPGLLIVGALNKGASFINRSMPQAQINAVLHQAFRAADGESRREMIARWEVIPMHALPHDAFREVISETLYSLGSRIGILQANHVLTGVDDVAVDLLYQSAMDICTMTQKNPDIGYIPDTPGMVSDHFCDMRYLSLAADRLCADAFEEIVRRAASNGSLGSREKQTPFILVGDRERNRISIKVAES